MQTQRSLRRPWRPWLDARWPPAEILWTRTQDGVELAIHRVPPTSTRRRGAVMLLHGLASNRLAFHFPGRSLSSYLADRGWDCFVPELRGAGRSQAPHLRFDLHDYLEWDLPAILEAIRKASGEGEIHWIGHSMGGILFMLHALRTGGEGLRSGVAVGSALDYRHGSVFQQLIKLRPLAERLPYVPFGGLTHLLAPLSGRLPRIDDLNFCPGGAEPEVMRKVQANMFGRIPVALLDSLSTLLTAEGPRDRQRGTSYRDEGHKLATPLYLLGGSRDVQCPVPAVQSTASLFPAARAEGFGRAFGHAQDYGHFCLLVGTNAPQEVWPRILAWLEER